MGLGSDTQCFKLVEYCYRDRPTGTQKSKSIRVQTRDTKTLHKNLVGVVKPSNLMHLGDKLLQLAASNSTDGTHLNTRAGL